jgi:hypothetical protein
MRRLLIMACAASLISLAACASESAVPRSGAGETPAIRPNSTASPAYAAPKTNPIADAEFETIRIDVMGMG